MTEPGLLVREVLASAVGGPDSGPQTVCALAYARVSTDKQEEAGLSIPAQLNAMQAYAKEHGIAVLETHVEAASGFQEEGKRAEFQRMLARAKSDKQVSVILVHEFSRFSRDPWRTPQVIGELQASGVRVVSVTEPTYDVNTVMGMWMQKVTEAKNASYSMEVAFHTRKGMRQNVSMRDPETGWCYKNGGKPPWGYRAVRIERLDTRGRPRFKAVWVLDEIEIAGKPLWRWTHDVLLRAAEGASLDGIRDMLNEAHVPAPRGGYWGTSTLHSLLERHMIVQYAGYGTWNVRRKRRQRWNPPHEWEVVENAHQAIITEEQAKVLLRVREQSRAAHGHISSRMSRVRSHGSRFVLSGGLFRCGRCGANMTAHRYRGPDGYLCGTAKYRRGVGCGQGVFVQKELIEEAVWETVQLLASEIGRRPSKNSLAEANAELRQIWERSGGKADARAQRELQKVDQKIANLRTALEDGLCDVAWANGRIRSLLEEKRRLAEAIGDRLESKGPPRIDAEALRKCLCDLRKLLPHATNEEKRELARRFLDGVTLEPDHRELEIRVKVPAYALQRVEAGAGIEPAHEGFADPCLATWLPRRVRQPSNELERNPGFVPATFGLGSRRSTN